MKDMMKGLLLALACIAFVPAASAADQGTADEAKKMVQKGISFLKANGKDKTLAAVSDSKGQFIDRDLYISVYDAEGVVVAHGTNAKLIGKNVMELKDADEKYFIKEIFAKAKAAGNGWVDYKWINPVSKEIQAKSVYLEKSGDLIFATGYYKK